MRYETEISKTKTADLEAQVPHQLKEYISMVCCKFLGIIFQMDN